MIEPTSLRPAPRARLERRSTPAVVSGWGTASPAHLYRQDELAAWLARPLGARAARRLRAAFRGSRVQTRGSVLPDFRPDCRRPVLFDGRARSTAERIRVYGELAPALAAEAARAALRRGQVVPARVTHLLFVTCTGLAAPGPDVDLVTELGLPRSVRRIQIGFQGCSAGIVALRTAAEIVRGEPGAVVLVVCAELCSLHFQTRFDDDDLRGHALFADGAAAAVVEATTRDRGTARARGGATVALGEGKSLLVSERRDDMSWEVEDEGFRMRLSAGIPTALADALPSFVPRFGRAPSEFAHWAVHPGGPTILDRVAASLDLPGERLVESRDVLRTCGNMSSATVLFVLERIARRGVAGDGLALAFGPGLTADGLLFSVIPGGE